MKIDLTAPLSGDWEVDKSTVICVAETPRSAAQFSHHVQTLSTLFSILTHGTALASPERKGLARKIHDELFPIAHFARIHYAESSLVSIKWHAGNQQFDATVEDCRPEIDRSNIRFLEVTTLQNGEDARLLKQLASSKNGVVGYEGDFEQGQSLQKADLLTKALKKKAGKKYPPNTALLVYTDEDRFAMYTFGLGRKTIDMKTRFEDVLNEMKHLLGGFSEVYIYSKNEIYCALQLDKP